MKTKPFYGISSARHMPGLRLSMVVSNYLSDDCSSTTPLLIANKANPIRLCDNSLDWNRHFLQNANTF